MALKIYGESSSMKAELKNDKLIFKLRLSVRLVMFLLSFICFSFVFFFTEVFFLTKQTLSVFPFIIALVISILIAALYKKYLIFDRIQKNFIIIKGLFGIQKGAIFSFNNIKIVVESKKSPIMGVQLPILVQKHSIKVVLLNNKKHIFLDRSSNLQLIEKYIKMISNITSNKVKIESEEQGIKLL